MNNLQYRINDYIYRMKNKNALETNEKDANEMYEYVSNCCDKFIEEINGRPISVTKEELEIILTQIYDVLKFELTKEEIMQSIESYLYYLRLTVTISQVNIDKEWCIEKVIYLNWNNSNTLTRKINNNLPVIKERLYNKFLIKKRGKSKLKTVKSG